jgi:hypothetical protein
MVYVEINNTLVNTKGLIIENCLTRTPDTASFVLENPDTAPAAGQSVEIYRDSTDNVLFKGVIVSLNKYKLAPNEDPTYRLYSYRIRCQDYQRFLDRYLVNESYTSSSCKTIIEDFILNFTDPAIGFTTNNVATGPTITKAVFSYKRVSECITEIADMVGYDWYVDENKDLHFFQRETRDAPFTINDSALVNKINNFSITPDYSQVRNRVYVRGSYYLSDNYTQTITADGTSRVFNLAWKPHDLSMTVGGVSVSVAVDNLYADDGTYDYFWNYTEKYIRCSEYPGKTTTPVAGTELAITYKYEVPILVRADNTISQTAIAALEGGDGIYESVVKDETIESKELAQDRAQAEVENFGNAMISGSFSTLEHGFKAGQKVDISCSGYESFAGAYQIQRVTIRPVTPNDIMYIVEFSTTLYELKDLLIFLLRQGKRIKIRNDEVVDVLKIISESITLADSVTLTKLGHPSKWDERVWDRFTWG